MTSCATVSFVDSSTGSTSSLFPGYMSPNSTSYNGSPVFQSSSSTASVYYLYFVNASVSSSFRQDCTSGADVQYSRVAGGVWAVDRTIGNREPAAYFAGTPSTPVGVVTRDVVPVVGLRGWMVRTSTSSDVYSSDDNLTLNCVRTTTT